MSTTHLNNPTSRVRFGLGRTEITPPVGIYHRMWGAATQDRATGVHRPLTCEIMIFGALSDGPGAPARHVRGTLDLCALEEEKHQGLIKILAEVTGAPENNIAISYSHTHASGWFAHDRIPLPGGDLIPGYLADLEKKVRLAAELAKTNVQEASISYATGHCNMAANRDYWDAERGFYACGFNPDAPADGTLLVARVSNSAGKTRAVIVNYGCHPTTLAWDNSLISPDFVGALRETVEQATGATCVYFQGACGDLGPREDYVGDTAIADKNGRQVGYAALSALESMNPPLTDFAYVGPVISGATLGDWRPRPQSSDRLAAETVIAGGGFSVDLAVRARPDRGQIERDLADWEAKSAAAQSKGEAQEARDARAYAERARRWLARLDDLPETTTVPVHFSVHKLGEAFWITCGGEPYNILQVELRRQFPDYPIFVTPIAGDLEIAYLIPADRYGKGLYQEEPSILGTGCLEGLMTAIRERVETMID